MDNSQRDYRERFVFAGGFRIKYTIIGIIESCVGNTMSLFKGFLVPPGGDYLSLFIGGRITPLDRPMLY